jgi:hypothetical protein
MKNTIIIVALALLLSGCASITLPGDANCLVGSGNITDETLGVGEFNSIELEFPADLYVTQGNRNRVRIEMEDNIFEDMELDVVGSVLTISAKNYTCYLNKEPINVYVTMEEVESLSIIGSGNIVGETKIVSDELELDVIGSGNIDLDVDANALDAAIDGSGKITLDVDADALDAAIIGSGNILLNGGAAEQKSSITGSGSIDADNLVSNNADIDIEGSGTVKVNAKNLDINIAGSGTVLYKGEPESLSKTIEGSGTIEKSG